MKNKFRVAGSLKGRRSNAVAPTSAETRESAARIFLTSTLRPKFISGVNKRRSANLLLKNVEISPKLVEKVLDGFEARLDVLEAGVEAMSLSCKAIIHAIDLRERGAETTKSYHKKRMRPCTKTVNPEISGTSEKP